MPRVSVPIKMSRKGQMPEIKIEEINIELKIMILTMNHSGSLLLNTSQEGQ